MKRDHRLAGFWAALALIAGLGADAGTFQAGSDVMAKLGVSPAAATEGMLDALASGTAFNAAAIKAFKALPASARAEVVRSALTWIKARTESAEFKASYAKMREDEKPKPPEAVPSVEDQMKKQKADVEKSIAEMQKNMAGLDPATRKGLEDAIKMMRKQVEEMQKPEQMAIMRQAAEMQAAESKRDYQERLKKWEEKIPTDPKLLIARRIRDFLEVSRDVDYSAKLVPAGPLMRFADARYEGKRDEWKLCFRAGKEATEAARAFASSWLADLGK